MAGCSEWGYGVRGNAGREEVTREGEEGGWVKEVIDARRSRITDVRYCLCVCVCVCS